MIQRLKKISRSNWIKRWEKNWIRYSSKMILLIELKGRHWRITSSIEPNVRHYVFYWAKFASLGLLQSQLQVIRYYTGPIAHLYVFYWLKCATLRLLLSQMRLITLSIGLYARHYDSSWANCASLGLVLSEMRVITSSTEPIPLL